ncbi:MAG: hypothetical protein ABW221_17635 [Vicinamibacteria bacterium]
MTLHEPATFATDLVLSALSLGCAIALGRRARADRSSAAGWLAAALASAGVAALAGALTHGFGPEMSPAAADALWRATLHAGGLMSFCLIASSAAAALGAPARTAFYVAALVQLVVFSGWVALHPEFRWLVFDYGLAIAASAALHLARLRRGDRPGALWILAGLGVSVAAALLQQSGLVLHAHFNHNDLYHVVQMLGTWLLYRGGRDLPARGA